MLCARMAWSCAAADTAPRIDRLRPWWLAHAEAVFAVPEAPIFVRPGHCALRVAHLLAGFDVNACRHAGLVCILDLT